MTEPTDPREYAKQHGIPWDEFRRGVRNVLDEMLAKSEAADVEDAAGLVVEILDPDSHGADSLTGLWPTDAVADAMSWGEKTVEQINRECPEFEPCTYRIRLVFKS